MNPIIPRVMGYVTKVYIKDNDYVKKGDTLFTIDNNDYIVKLNSIFVLLYDKNHTLFL